MNLASVYTLFSHSCKVLTALQDPPTRVQLIWFRDHNFSTATAHALTSIAFLSVTNYCYVYIQTLAEMAAYADRLLIVASR